MAKGEREKGSCRCSWFGGEDGLGPGRANPSQREGWLRARESIHRVYVARVPGLDYLYSPGQTREPGEQRGREGRRRLPPPPPQSPPPQADDPRAPMVLGTRGMLRAKGKEGKQARNAAGSRVGARGELKVAAADGRRLDRLGSLREGAAIWRRGSAFAAARCAGSTSQLAWGTWRGGIRERGAAGR